jgi:hypothetical protein
MKEDVKALRAMNSVVRKGGNPAILYELLYMYCADATAKEFGKQRLEEKKWLARFLPLQKKLESVAMELAKLEKDAETRPIANILSGAIAEMVCAVRNAIISDNSVVVDVRGVYRKEVNLAAASIFMRDHLQRPCFEELAHLLGCVSTSVNDGKEFDADRVSKICKRYLKSEQQIQAARMTLDVMSTETARDPHGDWIMSALE